MAPASTSEVAHANSKPHPMRFLSFVLLLAACFIDGADMQLLPASLKALETDLGFQPVSLGKLAMIQALCQAGLAPFWGSLADKGTFSKKSLLAFAVSTWGICTMMISTVSNFNAMVVLRALIGCCLACILPISQVCIAT